MKKKARIVVALGGDVRVSRIGLEYLSESHAVFEDDLEHVSPLPSVLRDFHALPVVRMALNSAKQADAHFPSLVKTLSIFLTLNGWNNTVIDLKHYFKSPGKGAGSKVLDQYDSGDTEDITHSVVKVNGLIVDPCKLRMGIHYDLPWNYPYPLLQDFWKHITPTMFNPSRAERARLMEGIPKNKYMQETEKEEEQ